MLSSKLQVIAMCRRRRVCGSVCRDGGYDIDGQASLTSHSYFLPTAQTVVALAQLEKCLGLACCCCRISSSRRCIARLGLLRRSETSYHMTMHCSKGPRLLQTQPDKVCPGIRAIVSNSKARP